MSRLAIFCVLGALTALVAAAPQDPATAGRVESLPENTALHELRSEDLQAFLANKESVESFTNCFLDYNSCTDKSSRNLIKQIRMLGLGGECPTCTMEQQMKVHDVVFEFIRDFMSKYPSNWRRVLPRLGFLL